MRIAAVLLMVAATSCARYDHGDCLATALHINALLPPGAEKEEKDSAAVKACMEQRGHQFRIATGKCMGGTPRYRYELDHNCYE